MKSSWNGILKLRSGRKELFRGQYVGRGQGLVDTVVIPTDRQIDMFCLVDTCVVS